MPTLRISKFIFEKRYKAVVKKNDLLFERFFSTTTYANLTYFQIYF